MHPKVKFLFCEVFNFEVHEWITNQQFLSESAYVIFKVNQSVLSICILNEVYVL